MGVFLQMSCARAAARGASMLAGLGREGGGTQGPPWALGAGATLGRFFVSLAVVGHLGRPATKRGGRGRPAGHAAVPPALPRVPFPLAGPWGPFFFMGSFLIDNVVGRTRAACRAVLGGPAKIKKAAPLLVEDELQHHVS
jgi:hypothetical protein